MELYTLSDAALSRPPPDPGDHPADWPIEEYDPQAADAEAHEEVLMQIKVTVIASASEAIQT